MRVVAIIPSIRVYVFHISDIVTSVQAARVLTHPVQAIVLRVHFALMFYSRKKGRLGLVSIQNNTFTYLSTEHRVACSAFGVYLLMRSVFPCERIVLNE
jgi:hypothetical protein